MHILYMYEQTHYHEHVISQIASMVSTFYVARDAFVATF